MTTLQLLADLRRAGVNIIASGKRLAFDAPSGAMPPDVRTVLKGRKPEILALLAGDWFGAAKALIDQTAHDGRADLLYLFDERAGVFEYDGNLPRLDAERLGYEQLAETVDRADRGKAV